jgi:hypothetical protein
MYIFLDYSFTIFHVGLILFNLFGWAWKSIRRLHLIIISLTVFSWFGLGIFYGWGYCPSTDWHWMIKQKLGETNLSSSFVHYCVTKLTGFDLAPLIVDAAVVSLGLLALVISGWLNWKDFKA